VAELSPEDAMQAEIRDLRKRVAELEDALCDILNSHDDEAEYKATLAAMRLIGDTPLAAARQQNGMENP
jgi:hypothetical protein